MKHFSFLILLVVLLLSCRDKKTDETLWLTGFVKPDENPIMVADSTYTFQDPIKDSLVRWQRADVFNPGAIVKEDTIFLLFRAEDNPKAILGGRTSRIGLAWSLDGINFNKFPEPVLYPDSSEFMKWDHPGGVEDPRVVEMKDGTYLMLYTSWNYETARLSAATSKDLRNWTKHGPVFEDAYNGKFLNLWSKSGSVITELKEGRLITVEKENKYWMYWGEDFVNLAFSENGLDWTPLINEDSSLLRVIEVRNGMFDSRLTEPGPPALLTDDGVLLFYNGKNAEDDKADPRFAKGTYSGGQVLLNKSDFTTVLNRMDIPFIQPDLPHEITGQYKAGTTFIEGLVFYKKKWYLYYGTADSMVGLAIKE